MTIHLQSMRHYERRLPHWNVIGAPLFVTFRLHGSLPDNRVFPPARLNSGGAFVAMDKLLDHARNGPLFLRQPEIASMIVEALMHGERLGRYEMHAFVVMPNHVHILATSLVKSSDWLRSLKGFTGRAGNKVLGRINVPFWQDESYDRFVRDAQEFRNIRRYIENNPVKAGLVTSPEDFSWSSSSRAEARLQAESLTPP
jgi:REP element-mobilizing transposase RayT